MLPGYPTYPFQLIVMFVLVLIWFINTVSLVFCYYSFLITAVLHLLLAGASTLYILPCCPFITFFFFFEFAALLVYMNMQETKISHINQQFCNDCESYWWVLDIVELINNNWLDKGEKNKEESNKRLLLWYMQQWCNVC